MKSEEQQTMNSNYLNIIELIKVQFLSNGYWHVSFLNSLIQLLELHVRYTLLSVVEYECLRCFVSPFLF